MEFYCGNYLVVFFFKKKKRVKVLKMGDLLGGLPISWACEGHMPSFFSFPLTWKLLLPAERSHFLPSSRAKSSPSASSLLASACLTSWTHLLPPLLHVQAAAAAAAVAAARFGRTEADQRQLQGLVGPPSTPARSRWFQASNFKLEAWTLRIFK